MSSTPNFDGLARIYSGLEKATFVNALWRCRCYFLPQLRACRRALLLGDGDGRFTARLLKVNPEIVVDALDLSATMLRLLQERAGPDRHRARTWRGDIRSWHPTGTMYDLVVSHFFLDCLTTDEVVALAARLRRCLLPGAKWLISEFAVPETGLGSLLAKPLIWVLYQAFGQLTGLAVRQLPKYGEALSAQGFIRNRQRTLLGGILVTELWSAPAG